MKRVTATSSRGKLLLVTQRFWPLSDDGVGRFTHLVEGLIQMGWSPTILTPRYASLWPSELEFREIPVLRPVVAARSDWAGNLYWRALTRWLISHGREYRVMYADSMRDEGAAVVWVGAQLGLPTIVRCGGWEEGADGFWAGQSRAHRKLFQIASRASAIVAPTAEAARSVASFVSDRSSVQRIDDGFPSLRLDDNGNDARRAFADVNSDLRLFAGDFVVLIANALLQQSNLQTVADALAIIAKEREDIRFWFVGEGTQREALHARLCELGVRNMAAIPGAFGHIDELWQVAKLVIAPCVIDGLEHRLPTAIGAGIPMIVADLPGMRTLLAARPTESTGSDCCFYPVDDAEFLAQQVLHIASHYPQALERAAQLRNRLCKLKPREHSIEQHHALLEKLLVAQSGNRSASVQENSP